MTESEPSQDSNDDKPQAATVAHAVLEKFFSELEKTDGFAEVAPKLRTTILSERLFTEAAIRTALNLETS